LIADIKSDFRSEISLNDPKVIKFRKVRDELFKFNNQVQLFEMNKKEKADWNKKIKQLSEETNKLETEIEEIKANKIYENAFEWRFEFPEVLNDNGDFVGFDVVIGNPPYISHDKIDFREYLKSNYKCFEAFADLYCYFFEKGISILTHKGYLNFITSNSFLKAEYGKPLRDYFNDKGQFVQLINIEDAQIFEDAIVNTVVANFAKGKSDIKSQIVNQKYNIQDNFIDFIERHSFEYDFDDFKIKSWNLAKPEQINLGRKISNMGKTLEEIGAKIRLGIATGSNEAFVIDEDIVNRLIAKDPKSKDLIKPLLRGKDINRYSYQQEKYILLTKNGIDVKKEYPAIYEYLDSFGDGFKKRGAKGNHWTNLRACSFFDDFKEPKIIWIELTDTNKFAICDDEIYLLNSAYFLLPPKDLNINYLNGLLNSKVIKYYLRLIANTSGVGTARWINIYVKDFPIARGEMIETKIEEIVTKILFLKKQKPATDTTNLENQIDQLVYQLYGLTEEEIKIIENN
jgi:adenine-specific DNA-methyltransferase